MRFLLLGTCLLVLQLIPFFLEKSPVFENSVSYTKDAKPIFEKRCSVCHGPNWPDKNWMDYDIAVKNKDKIKFRLENLTMPPGNSTGMTKEERVKVIKWVETGAKK